ncbi:unnamed protein product [Pylaiella littoralis]
MCVGVPFLLVSSLVAWAAHCLWHHPTRDNGLLTTLKLVPGPCSLDVKPVFDFISIVQTIFCRGARVLGCSSKYSPTNLSVSVSVPVLPLGYFARVCEPLPFVSYWVPRAIRCTKNALAL